MCCVVVELWLGWGFDNLRRHKRENGVKYSGGQCDHQASSNGKLKRHINAVHEGIKYPCRQCEKQFSQKDDVSELQKALHEE